MMHAIAVWSLSVPSLAWGLNDGAAGPAQPPRWTARRLPLAIGALSFDHRSVPSIGRVARRLPVPVPPVRIVDPFWPTWPP